MNLNATYPLDRSCLLPQNSQTEEQRQEQQQNTQIEQEEEQQQQQRQTLTDYQLVRQTVDGDARAFEELYKRHHRRVYSLTLRMTGNVSEAEDLTQEAFIQLHRKAGSFRGESAFTTWLHRLTVNIVLMHFRKRSIRDERTTDEGEMPEQVVLGTAVPERMQIIDRIALDDSITQLPLGYRTVFVLHDVEGFEHEEIAMMLKVAVGTSKSQLHKARMKLRRILTKQKT